ncbi:glycosyltransferase family 4 protein (plasmid) [Pseudorhodobacter turbinis]|uniref:Glycosyltransferase family 4 protein n=1 Tax=Pseudorhodobacter turbinis TaxID=2500533 RepID=A0A4P8EI79_9RHOB|nr:glycosyltransferase family 4 protein [Pseudorhodobacter turbinis]QCO56676.1 glycosyltransferase family 4 protein [Pseudorhodobacter turbinis]
MTNLPRIGYVLKRYPRYSETFVVTEILAHEAAGLNIDIFALRPVEEAHFQDMLGRVRAPVHRVPDSFRTPQALWSLICKARDRLPGGWAALQGFENAEGRDVAQAIFVALACHERGISHLHAHFGTVSTSVARLAARLAGITYSFTAHAKDIYHAYDTPVGLDAKLRDAATAVTVSDYNVAYLRDQFGGDADKVTRIYNGLDLDRFAWSAPAAPAGEILAVGRLVEKKGFDILIDAVAHLRAEGRAATCRIIGGGEAEAALRSRIAAAGLEGVIRLDGPRPQNEVIAALRGAAMLACPCVVGEDGNRDGLPTVLLEAMALGTPCVATDVTGIPELVRDGETGLCVAQNDAKALAAAMARLLDDPALGRDMSRAGRDLIEAEFDITRNAARLRDVFADAVQMEAV